MRKGLAHRANRRIPEGVGDDLDPASTSRLQVRIEHLRASLEVVQQSRTGSIQPLYTVILIVTYGVITYGIPECLRKGLLRLLGGSVHGLTQKNIHDVFRIS